MEKVNDVSKEVVDKKEGSKRPDVLSGSTIKTRVGCGVLYVTINVKKDDRYNEYPINEVWITPSFKDKEALYCCNAFLIPFARLLTFILRRIDVNDRGALIKQLRHHECPKKSVATAKSCVDAVARVLLCYWEGHRFKNGRCYVCGEKEVNGGNPVLNGTGSSNNNTS